MSSRRLVCEAVVQALRWRVTAGRWRPVVALLLGVLIVVALTAIAVLGPVLTLLIALLGLGGLVLAGCEEWRRHGMEAAGEVPFPAAIPVRPAA